MWEEVALGRRGGQTVPNMAAGAMRLLLTKNSPWMLLSALVIGRLSPVFRSSNAQKKSLYMNVNRSVAIAASAGRQSGRITLHHIRRMLAPSTSADSVISLVIVFM